MADAARMSTPNDLTREDTDRFFCEACPEGVPLVGVSPAMRRTLKTLRTVAESRCNPVLLLGETGTGKELAARAVHGWRHGGAKPFVAVNCAALTANLLESELFGHVKGSFTGADREKTGLFAAAGDGTIFLDEISEMPLELQAKLLRVLQERVFRKVGGTTDESCHATIVATSNRDLLQAVEDGEFRRDLYYRLAVFPVVMPTLRSEDRREDISLLAEWFLQTTDVVGSGAPMKLTADAADALARHDWPGNVRELRNVMDRAAILAGGPAVSADCLILDSRALSPLSSGGVSTGCAAASPDDAPQDPKDFSLETAERQFIIRALKETGWQRTRAAALLGITRATLHAKLKRYDIEAPSPGKSSGKNTAACA